MLLHLLATYLPFSPAALQGFWSAVMTTIGSTVAVGFIIFAALFCIDIFKSVLRAFWH
jgi:hypothetical protein